MAKRFENYQILAELGRGGMGIVYKARDLRNDRIVAIKQLILENIDPAKHQEFRERFQREAETVLALKHDNIVELLEISSEPDSHYYVMEHLEGNSLRKEIIKQGGRFKPRQYLPLLEQMSNALSFAHTLNVVHRDVKPDNIFILKDGTVKLTDFGIARIADLEATNLTKTGVMLGTLAYVSPEQLQNAKTVDHRADIFSLGVVTYEALSGDLPFTGDGIAATIVKIMSQEEVPLHIVLPSLGAEVSSCVTRSLRKRPRDRYRSVVEFVRDFKLAVEQLPANQDDEPALDLYSTSVDIVVDSALTAYDEPACQSASEEVADLDDTRIGANELSDYARNVSLDREGILKEKDTHKSSGGDKSIKEGTSFDTGGSLPKDQTNQKPNRGQRQAAGMAARLAQSLPPTISSEYKPIRAAYSIKEAGEDKSPFAEPAVVAYRSGRIIVADTAKRVAHIFSHDGRWLTRLTQRPEVESKTGGGRFTKLSGLAFDERGRIYACDSSDHYIRIFDSQGSYLKEFKNIQGKEGGLQGIAIDSTGLLYVSDASTGTLQVFQSDVGVWVRDIGSKGTGEGQFQLPSGLATDRLNRIYVVDYGTSKVSVFNRSGIHLRTFGRKGKEKGMFNVPRAVVVDRYDRIYVLDSLNHRIQVFGSSGDWLHTFGSLGSGMEQFVGPSDLCIDNENNLLFVADKGNKRIQVLELTFK
ncbi:MAG: protein kinase [Candidatus Obscuribacterales bacterium]|nr:protein kinase [Candidatus Obscuribacterales bacterium]